MEFLLTLGKNLFSSMQNKVITSLWSVIAISSIQISQANFTISSIVAVPSEKLQE
jgi:hypothetical protein